MPAIHEWLCSNRLTLNLSKTKYLVFQPRQKINSNLYPPLKIADQYLEQSYSVKYLGLITVVQPKAGTGHKMQTVSVVFNVTLLGIYR